MKRVRVLLADLPGLLQSILNAKLRAENGTDVINLTEEHKSLSAAIREHRPDVPIADGDRAEFIDALRSIVDYSPGLEIVAVTEFGRKASANKLSLSHRELGEPSPDSLTQLIVDVLGSDTREGAP